jgi:demethylmenaquinone methyltransferase/2-methoxy-6-polyprenyl-1,4-benzoquinol methylase
MGGKRNRKDASAEDVRVSALQRLEPYFRIGQTESVPRGAEFGPEPDEAQTPSDVTAEIPVVVPDEEDSAEMPSEIDIPAEVVVEPESPVASDPVFAPEPEANVPVEAVIPIEPDVEEPDMTPHAGDALGVRAELDKVPVDVAAMFDRVAARYDLVNDLLALGQTRIWRDMVVRAVNPGPGDRILDLAAGTGTSSAPFAARGAEVVPCDFSLGMLEVGKRRQPALPFVAGDALNLPFRDNVFDAVTISFGLRNVHDTERALQEMLRVTKPGGKIVVCEFSTPVFAPFRTVYMNYLMKALPAIARHTSSNPAAYVYLAESIREWPDQRHLAVKLQQAGWERVQWRNATGGIVAIHRGYKPVS